MKIHNVTFKEDQYKQLLCDLCIAISKQNADTDNMDYLAALTDAVLDRKILFNTQILLNFRNAKTMGACTVLRIDDEIQNNVVKAANDGVGFGVNLDSLPDPISWLIKLNSYLLLLDKNVERRVAAIATMDVNNPNVLDFIKIKRDANFNNWRMNLSVYVSDCFMDSVIRAIETGEKSDEMQIFMNMVDSMWYCGEPGILFLDRINEGNPLPDCKYEGMAPCAELAMNGGERCHFAYINVARFVKDGQVCFQDLINTVRLITTALDNLIDVSIAADYNPVVANKRRISIGICGLAELFIMLKVPYGSEESLDITNEVMSVINYYSKATSMNLASLRGSFPWLDKSRLLDHEWFMSHGKGVSRHISNEMWESLWEQILENGIRNCATTALPPTGNSAYINHTTYSVEPIFHYNYEFVENTVKELSYSRASISLMRSASVIKS